MAKAKQASKKSTVKLTKNSVAKAPKKVAARFKSYLTRRPHRSFQLTKRRDYKRSFDMPGYWSFTNTVTRTLLTNWKLFGGLAVIYAIVIVAVTGADLQDIYTGLKNLLDATKGDFFSGTGAFGAVSQAGLLLFATVTTGLSPDLTKPQSILAGLAFFFVWLATIWLLRNVLAGHKPRLRDGLYNSGAPVLASIAVGAIILLQLIPAAVASIVYSAAQTSGLLDSGVSGMLAWAAIVLLVLLSVYWITSSLVAMVVVTLPGMYPMRAIRAAGDLIVGRRLRVLLRLFWMLGILAVAWAILVIPIILFDNWIKHAVTSISWFPLVPIITMVLSSLTLIFVTTYIYLLYRRIVDDEAGPA